MLKNVLVLQQIEGCKGGQALETVLGELPASFSLQHVDQFFADANEVADVVGGIAQLFVR